jgi:tetratricopeptide (TPR) repeat protein
MFLKSASLTCSVSVLALAALLAAGCQSSNNSSAGAKSNPRTTNPDKFETTADPPLKARTRFAAGQLAESQGDTNRAIQQYWEAVKVDPKCDEALFRLGVLYCQLKDYPDAIISWKLYLKATNDDATGYSNLAFCEELAGHRAAAESAYRKGLEKDPQNRACRVNFGLMLARDNKLSEATIQLQTVLTAAEVHYNLASVMEQQGKKDQARAEYRKALDLDPNLSDAQVRLDVMK